MGAVRGSKGVIDEELRPITDLLRPFRVISGVLGAEAGVFEEENLSTFHPLNRLACEGAGRHGAKTDGRPEEFLELSGNGAEGESWIRPAPGPPQMRQQNRLRPRLDKILDRGQSADKTRIVDDLAIFIERQVVIYPNDHDFVGEGLRGTVY